MTTYFLNDTDKGTFIQIKKNYIIQIKKADHKILLIKKNKQLCFDNNNLFNQDYFGDGYINSKDIDKQLANIKHIGFEVTDSCNLKCTYCIYGKFYNNHDIRTYKKIDIKKAILLINFLLDKVNSPANKSLTNEIFISFYGGEPLLNMKFIKEIVNYTQKAQDNHIRFKYMMTTNGTYLKRHFDFLFKYNFIITVSLDGSEENDAYRKFENEKKSFKIVYQNLKHIQHTYPTYFNSNIKINSVIHNLNNQQEIISFIYTNFNKIPHISRVNPTGVDPQFKTLFEKMIQPKPCVDNKDIKLKTEKILDLNTDTSNLLQDFIFHYSGNVFDNYNELLVKKNHKNYLPTATCFPFSRRIFMTVNNKIFPCERIGHQYVLGEITDKEVNIDYDYIANKYNTYYNSIKKICTFCFFKTNCRVCMFNIHDLGRNPICDQIADKQKFSEYIHKNIEVLASHPELYTRIMKEIVVIK